MLNRTHKQVMEYIERTETPALTNIKIDDMFIWPLVRFQLVHKMFHGIEPSPDANLPPAEPSLKALLYAYFLLPCLLIKFVLQNQRRSADFLFFSRPDELKYFTKGKKNNPIALGWQADLSTLGSTRIIEMESLNSGELLGVLRTIYSKKIAKNLNETAAFETIKSLTAQIPVQPHQGEIHSDCLTIYAKAQIYSLLLRLLRPKAIFYTVFYTLDSFALARAANKLNIQSVEIQHGLDGTHSPHETHFQFIPTNGYDLLPTSFWVWGQTSERRKKCFINSAHRVFVGGNPTTNLVPTNTSTRSQNSLTTILLALQPVQDPIPSFLESLMSEPNYSYLKWHIRLHPDMHHQINDYVNRFKHLKNVDIQQATRNPLHEELLHADVVASKWSTVLLESLIFGKLAVVVSPEGKALFSEEIESNTISYSSSKESFLELLSSSTQVTRNNDYIEMDRNKISRNLKANLQCVE